MFEIIFSTQWAYRTLCVRCAY